MTIEERLKEIEERAADDEVWRDIKGAPGYQVSSFGNVRSELRRGNWKNKRTGTWRLLAQATRKDGRRSVSLPLKLDGGYRHVAVHRLVALTFHGECPDGMEVAHLNGDSADNRASNLKYCTHQENESHKLAHGTLPIGEKNTQAKLREWQVEEIKFLASRSIPHGKIAALFGIRSSAVANIARGDIWSHTRSRADVPMLVAALREAVSALKEQYEVDDREKIQNALERINAILAGEGK